MRKLNKYKPTKFMAKDSTYSQELADYAVVDCSSDRTDLVSAMARNEALSLSRAVLEE